MIALMSDCVTAACATTANTRMSRRATATAPKSLAFMCSPPLHFRHSRTTCPAYITEPHEIPQPIMPRWPGWRTSRSPCEGRQTRNQYNAKDVGNGKHAGRPRGSPRRLSDVLPVVVSLACAGLFSFLSGGYIFTRSAPIAIAYLLLAAVWVWFIKRRSWPPALFLAALAAFALFTGWIGLSTLWSFGPDLSWVAFDVASLYLAVLAVVGCTRCGGCRSVWPAGDSSSWRPPSASTPSSARASRRLSGTPTHSRDWTVRSATGTFSRWSW